MAIISVSLLFGLSLSIIASYIATKVIVPKEPLSFAWFIVRLFGASAGNVVGHMLGISQPKNSWFSLPSILLGFFGAMAFILIYNSRPATAHVIQVDKRMK
jgi:uncharacterized membrane protein YeaQ/YmgE (transglycosylase-associated protein family)